MKSRPVYCESCWDEPADIYADGYWLCSACEEEHIEDMANPIFSGLEYAEIKWGCKPRLIQGGQT